LSGERQPDPLAGHIALSPPGIDLVDDDLAFADAASQATT